MNEILKNALVDFCVNISSAIFYSFLATWFISSRISLTREERSKHLYGWRTRFTWIWLAKVRYRLMVERFNLYINSQVRRGDRSLM